MIHCPKCDQVKAISRSGIVRGKQRYYCKDCNSYFTLQQPSFQNTTAGPRKHMATIADIARALHISNSTVSRALHQHGDINPQTREAVLRMARELDYQPNLLAQSLVNSKTNTIGIIVPEFLTYFFPTVIIGAQKVAAAAGYNVIICQSQESFSTEVANANVLLSNRVDGVLISMTRETRNYEHFKTFERYGIPVVFFNRVCEEMETSKVLVNDYEGAYKAVEHLIASGYRHIAHIGGPPSLQITYNRLNGYKDALAAYQLPFDENLVVHSDLSTKAAWQCAEKLLSRRKKPDAVFCVNDPTAIQLMLYAKKKGIRIPDELGVVGFSNDPMAAVIEPALTTVQQPVEDMGKTAMEILLDTIKHRDEGFAPVRRGLQTKLIIRQSSVRSIHS